MATFGHNPGSGGATPEDGSDNYVQVFGPFTLSEVGTATLFSVWLSADGDAATVDMRGVIYADSSGSPGALTAQTNARSLTSSFSGSGGIVTAGGYTDFTFASNPALSAGVYWLGFQQGNHANGITRFAYDTGIRRYKAQAYASGPQDPFGTADGNDTKEAAIYVTYTPGAGSPPVAAFSGTPLTITSGQTVTFTDASTNTPTSWLWEKNDGTGWVNFDGTPTAQNPTEVFD